MKEWKFLKAIGCEVEAAWTKPRNDLHPDGSIRYEDFEIYNICREKGIEYTRCIGELISKPFSSMRDTLKWLEENYPDESNAKCGTHWHFSFLKPAYYGQLMTPKFHKYFLKSIKEWGDTWPCSNKEFWSRLNGDNRYCSPDFRPDKQIFARTKGDHRYTHLNYCHALHGTIECRLFPTFQMVRTAKGAIQALVDCIENYLEENPPVIDGKTESIELEEPIYKTEEEVFEELSPIKKELQLEPYNQFSKEKIKGNNVTKYFEIVKRPRVKKEKIIVDKIVDKYINIDKIWDWDRPNFLKHRLTTDK